ncbi:Delta-aminolevulinic acid dehydratase [Operophtera brumata]|uniref:porphobilinogen synthase n=1 Tax=Operophtera brumata TaxID=104452 RepID=A0A0L7KT49_OPEBR|nr:Delta-aminolevulinic acid dehydratase [Operophtera brumata]
MDKLFSSHEHVLQGGFFQDTLRKLQAPNTSIEPHNLMYPVFLLQDEDACQAVQSMPNVFRYGVNALVKALADPDPIGSNADSADNPVIKALPVLRAAYPDLLIACDVCLCPYTSHGHCGLLTESGSIDHAPSFASSMYGPFRDTMNSSPMAGDRKCYQLPPGSAGLAARAAPGLPYLDIVRQTKDQFPHHPLFVYQVRDVAEDADFLIVKPGLPYLDIVRQTKDQFPHHPLFVYQVRDVAEGAEFLMVKPGLPYLDIVRQTKDQFPHHPLFIYNMSYGLPARI